MVQLLVIVEKLDCLMSRLFTIQVWVISGYEATSFYTFDKNKEMQNGG